MTSSDRLQDHRPKALIYTIIAYGSFLALLYFVKLAYDPPVEELSLGVDLNYGVDLVGSGDLQTLNKANPSPVPDEMAPSDKADVAPKPQPKQPQPTEIQKNTVKPVAKPVATKKVITSEVEKTPVASAKTASKPSPSPSNAPVAAAKPSPPAPPAPQRTVDQGSLFGKKGASSSSNGTVGTKEGIGGNNNGDGKSGQVGDQGSPQGTLDGKSLYGKPGSGGGTSGGASVNISGWKKRSISLPKDNSSETGKIVFSVSVDSFGEVKSITVLERTVSPSVVNFYRDYLQRKLSSFLVADGTPPSMSTGKITILIKSGS